MAFNKEYLARASVALNTGMVIAEGTEPASPCMWTYRSAGDAIATVVAANYFADAVWQLSVNDLIYISASDAVGMYVVDAVDRAAGTISLVAASLTGSVNTANIVDLAVTTGKLAANAVTSAKVSALLLQYATVAVTAAQFNGMYAAPKLLLAAGGANTLIVPHKVELLMTYGSAAYAAGGVAAVQYDSTVNGAGVIATSTLSAATFQAAASTGFVFNGGVVPQTFSTCVNKGLYLSNITGAFTTGDSDMVAHIWYSVIPTV